ncbi:GntR family transcriptional regulator [Hoeflea sp. WL0058]|uniref:GntR family transcriptional regulator n=1 Tax=Flavimaribacter sediminis TaxID=2865987 RepID=A0AAE2ZMZ1_9HYPH|nr:GntR family transcriptional regulator [Flavimaribacter sediminis]MBW8639176.1 GntR family transcriptional regulator [Flavimaribacter sediminis]
MKLHAIRRKSVPLHAEMAEHLRARILRGELQAGAELPPLSSLVKEYGLARMTVRKAMDSLEAEGLIERYSGRGTFVRAVAVVPKTALKVHADLSQLEHSVSDLEVGVGVTSELVGTVDEDGTVFRRLRRVHTRNGKPFCLIDLKLVHSVYDQAPERFDRELVLTVMRDLGVQINSAKQIVSLDSANTERAERLNVPFNTPLFKVNRTLTGAGDTVIYSAETHYPGDALQFDIEFTVGK